MEFTWQPKRLGGGYVINPPESTAAVAGGTVGAVEVNGQRPDTLHPDDTSMGPVMSSASCSRLLGQSDCCGRRSPLRNFLHNIRPKLGAMGVCATDLEELNSDLASHYRSFRFDISLCRG